MMVVIQNTNGAHWFEGKQTHFNESGNFFPGIYLKWFLNLLSFSDKVVEIFQLNFYFMAINLMILAFPL